MSIEGENLIVEPSYPWAKIFDRDENEPDEDEGWSLINRWYSARHRADILVMKDPEGKIVHGKHAAFNHLTYDIKTLMCSEAWGLEQEQKALQLLGTLISHRQMKQYVLTGQFLESSKRSGVFYFFRRLKPTIACAPDRGSDDQMRVLCALCMHPIAYYQDSWAGAMCPTDDIIAHLMMMRGDEHMLWKRCSQHPAYRPEAGL